MASCETFLESHTTYVYGATSLCQVHGWVLTISKIHNNPKRQIFLYILQMWKQRLQRLMVIYPQGQMLGCSGKGEMFSLVWLQRWLSSLKGISKQEWWPTVWLFMPHELRVVFTFWKRSFKERLYMTEIIWVSQNLTWLLSGPLQNKFSNSYSVA